MLGRSSTRRRVLFEQDREAKVRFRQRGVEPECCLVRRLSGTGACGYVSSGVEYRSVRLCSYERGYADARVMYSEEGRCWYAVCEGMQHGRWSRARTEPGSRHGIGIARERHSQQLGDLRQRER
eukprot:3147053-Rhodomonas_salina.2